MIEKSHSSGSRFGKRLMNVKEMAEYIGKTVGCIYAMKAQHKIPASCIVPIGGLMFDKLEVDKWIDSSKPQPVEGLDC